MVATIRPAPSHVVSRDIDWACTSAIYTHNLLVAHKHHRLANPTQQLTAAEVDLCAAHARTPRLPHELRETAGEVSVSSVRVGLSEGCVDLLLESKQFLPQLSFHQPCHHLLLRPLAVKLATGMKFQSSGRRAYPHTDFVQVIDL